MTRGLSQAANKAAEYCKKHPETKGADVARKFGLNLTTVYRSAWWKQRRAEVQKTAGSN